MGARPVDMRSVDVSWNNAFRKIFNACWRESVKPLQFYCSCPTRLCPCKLELYVHQRRILFWLIMVRSDNIILHTLAGCSRDSVVALLDKYSPIDSHCEPSMLSSCVMKRWFWLYCSNLCQAVWPSIGSIHSFIHCMSYFVLLLLLFFYFILFYFILFCICFCSLYFVYFCIFSQPSIYLYRRLAICHEHDVCRL